MKTIKLILLLLLLSSINLLAQKKFAKEQLVADADVMYTALKVFHPDLFAVYPQDKWEMELEEMKGAFTDSMTMREFAVKTMPLVAKLGDGHTSVRPPISEDLFDKFIPLEFYCSPEYTIRVEDNYQPESVNIPVGSEILSINGLSSKEYVKTLLSFLSGEREDYKLGILNKKEDKFTILNAFQAFVFYTKSFDITYKYKGETKSIVVPATTVERIVEYMSYKVVEKTKGLPYSFTIDEDKNLAILDFKSFVNPKAMKVFADSLFRTLQEKGITNLIIDVRGNGGGDSTVGDTLLQYISQVPYQQFGGANVNMSKTVFKHFQQKYIKEDKLDSQEYKDFVDRYEKENYGVAKYRGASLVSLHENKYRFQGNVYLLASSFTFSSGTSFTWAFKYFKMGTLIGEETGGNVNSFGDVIAKGLPNTGARLGISYKKFYSYGASDDDKGGVKPDYEVPAKDAMQFAIDMIAKKEKEN